MALARQEKAAAVMRMKSWFSDTATAAAAAAAATTAAAAAVSFHLLGPKAAIWCLLGIKWASIKTDNHLKLRLLPRTRTVILFSNGEKQYEFDISTSCGWVG